MSETNKAQDKPHILVVDDDATQRQMLSSYLENHGFKTYEASRGEEALDVLTSEKIDLVVTDVQMPGMSGLELMKRILEDKPSLPILIITAYGDIRDAVAAVKDGAVSYLEKPMDLEELLDTLRHTLGVNVEPDDTEQPLPPLPEWFVAESPAIRDLVREVALIAPSDVRVLITGENGTGKEVIADLLHQWSKRANKAIVKVNCAAIPENLLESELFGHEKGAFTGATSQRQGHFARANGGTIFLDEIGEMPLALQVKLLRVTEQGTFIPIGGSEQNCNVRILAATNRDLEEEVAEGRFREDLFFRLNTFELYVPPLRERREDIVPLAKHFASTYGGAHKRFSPAVTSLLNTYDWQGNVRELRNAMERAVLMTSGSDVIVPEHLPKRIGKMVKKSAPQSEEPVRPIEEIERITILQTLKKNGYNRSKTAKDLGMSRRTLTYKIRRLKDAGYEVNAPG